MKWREDAASIIRASSFVILSSLLLRRPSFQREVMNRAILKISCVGLCLLCGCEGKPPSREELGTLVFDEAKVPGADKPYTLPEYLQKALPAPEPERRKPGE
jgi:hypothetical protein